MQIHVKKTREARKGLLSGRDCKLGANVGVTLPEEGKSLVQKYRDPSVSTSAVSLPGRIWLHRDGSDDSYKEVKTEQAGSDSGSFAPIASAKGHEYLEAPQKPENATIAALPQALGHLKHLDGWEGGQVLGKES